MEEFHRTITAYKNHFPDFLKVQNDQVKKKIIWLLKLIETQKMVSEKFLKHLEGTKALYEIRLKIAGDYYRIICFFDQGNLIILLNAFQKKSDKTPHGEIERAEKLRQEYYENKRQ